MRACRAATTDKRTKPAMSEGAGLDAALGLELEVVLLPPLLDPATAPSTETLLVPSLRFDASDAKPTRAVLPF